VLEIVSRAEWGARPPTSKVTGDVVIETFLHHTAGSGGGVVYMRAIQDYHMDVQGWSDIAYNFVVDPNSLVVYEGRGWGVRPGSQKSHNIGTWSVCVMGNYQTKQPTQGLLETIAGLINLGAGLGHIPLVLTGGHKDAPDQSTSCPGQNLHSQIPTIRTLLEADMPLTQDDLNAIEARVRAVMGPTGTITDANGNARPFHQYTVNGVWHAVAGGKRMMDHLLAAGSETPVDEAAIAQAVVAAMTPGLQAAVAAELQKLTLKAS
jgi:hypothetical protein